jgi:1,3-beta-glucanosyltransferase GAS1
MNGIAYQQDSAAGGASTGSTKYLDPLADEAACRRDVPLLKQLRTNTIRTYAIDPTADHTVCMKLLDDAGIYVISDLSEPKLSINRDDPHWDIDLLDRYTAVVDELAKYSNVIGFFAGNEVTNEIKNTNASAFVKAAVRDTKAHIKKNHNRWLGVGYASNDDADIRNEIAAYFNCGPQEDAIDYWGYNIYSWCGKSSFERSGYKTQVEFFSNYSVPVFLAEYGCNVPNGASERIWEETTALYSDQMTGVFSGGIVYMYFQEENDYGKSDHICVTSRLSNSRRYRQGPEQRCRHPEGLCPACHRHGQDRPLIHRHGCLHPEQHSCSLPCDRQELAGQGRLPPAHPQQGDLRLHVQVSYLRAR